MRTVEKLASLVAEGINALEPEFNWDIIVDEPLMKLPNATRVVVEIEKLRDYCLNTSHPRGRHKARVFESVLGITADDAQELRQALLAAALAFDVTSGEQDEYGQRYVLDFPFEQRGKQAFIRSSWIIRAGEDYPRLTTCYVL